jgi:hypothetical protein
MRRWLHKTRSARKHTQRVAITSTGNADMTWCYGWSLAARVKDLGPCANGKDDVHPVRLLCGRKEQSPRSMSLLATVCKRNDALPARSDVQPSPPAHNTSSRTRTAFQNNSRYRPPISIILSSILWLRLANGQPVKKCLTDFPLMHTIGAPVPPLEDIRQEAISKTRSVNKYVYRLGSRKSDRYSTHPAMVSSIVSFAIAHRQLWRH